MIRTLIKASMLGMTVMTTVLISITLCSGASVRFKHVVSIYADERDVSLRQPESVACSEESSFLVADTGNGRLLRYMLQNGALKTESKEIKVPQLSNPIRIQINSKGEIYALDGKQRRIVHLSPEGAFIEFVAPKGLPSQESFVPRSFIVDMNDNIYILDISSQRVLLLNAAGEYQRQIDFPDSYGFLSDLTVDNKGNVFLVDSINAMVFSAAKNSAKFSAITAKLKQYMRFPTSIRTDQRGRIYLVDRNDSRVIILGQDGSLLGRFSGLGWKEGFLNHPSGICINSEGTVFIADTSNSRIQIFTTLE